MERDSDRVALAGSHMHDEALRGHFAVGRVRRDQPALEGAPAQSLQSGEETGLRRDRSLRRRTTCEQHQAEQDKVDHDDGLEAKGRCDKSPGIGD
jgi:hypothetical protein